MLGQPDERTCVHVQPGRRRIGRAADWQRQPAERDEIRRGRESEIEVDAVI
jgi:hypothetical protein